MIPRAIEALLPRLAAGYPVLVLTGARQTGKTTIAKAHFADRPFVNLEDVNLRAAASEDPGGFLRRFPNGAVLDEVQRVPELFPALQVCVDASQKMGQWVLTGSQQFGLIGQLTQSLAGRAAFIELHPFTSSELLAVDRLADDWETCAWRGGYPPLYDRPVTPNDWHADYIASYLERDVRQLTSVRDLGLFRNFIRMTAARTGQLLNVSSLAADTGISAPTAQAWLTVLEASHLIVRVQPWHRNIGKRLVKMTKLYWLDTGLCCHLLGLSQPEQLHAHPLRGAVFETWVVADLIKMTKHTRTPGTWWFFRTNSGLEVDLLFDAGGQLRPIEIKSSHTMVPEWHKTLETFRRLVGPEVTAGTIVYGGNAPLQIHSTNVIPWRQTAALTLA